ncbi:MAG: calcium/sodium antiporter [Nanoarchaeota archaeon]|nr:calcium/sodium antiporter [Nanoarchaeota archaeon]MBU1631789.1 calcium/sodium antiporter [Nanoarchaeota archaeon]MBU1876016.1 calcium/sodium antiporter [Nanoarchaeota archaeon]
MLEIIYLLLIVLVSLSVLIKSADYLVDGAADLATFLRISPILVGLTVVAFGTSLPEFIVSLFSIISGKADISIGNIVGSNIANIALIIGVCSLLTILKVKSKTLIYEFHFLIVSSFLFLLLADNNFIFGKDSFSLDRIDGIIFIIIFIFFLYYVFKSMNKEQKSTKKEFKEEFKHKNPLWKNLLLIVGGILGVIIGGKLFIDFASRFALIVGFSDAFVGLAIAALGTSLPELATSGIAAWKKHGDIAIGNIVGSNIFNILFVLGTISLFKPIEVSRQIIAVDSMIMIFVTLLFLVFATKRKGISKKEGAVLLGIYLLYMGFLIWRL